MHEFSKIIIQIPVGAGEYTSNNCISLIDIFLNTAYQVICQWFNCFICCASNSINFSLLLGCHCLNKSY